MPFPFQTSGRRWKLSTSRDAPREVRRMNLKGSTEGGETARRQCFFVASFAFKFPTLSRDAIPNAAAATVAHRPPARVICLAPALARPKRLDYTPSPVRKQAGNQILRNRENIGRNNSQSSKHWNSGQTYFPMFIQPWFVQFHTNHNLISMLATSRIPMRKIWQEFNAVAQIHPPS